MSEREKYKFVGRRTPQGFGPMSDVESYVWKCDNPSDPGFVYVLRFEPVATFFGGSDG